MTLVKVAGEAQTGWAFLEMRARKSVGDPAGEAISASSLKSELDPTRMPASELRNACWVNVIGFD